MSKMRKKLDQLENQLRALIEGSAEKVFPSSNVKDDLAIRLVNAMRNEIKVDQDGQQTAPNLYTLLIPPQHALTLRENQTLLNEVAYSLEEYARGAGLHMDGKPILKVVPLHPDNGNELRVLANFSQAHLVETSQIEVVPSPDVNAIPAGAFVIVNSKQIFPLNKPVINIGRGEDNDLVIDDLHVSREHAQLRAIQGSYMIFDLNSSGGTFINGERISHKELAPGDLVSLAVVPLIYGQEQRYQIEETQDMRGLDIKGASEEE